jgi:hypothetical protein
MRARAGRAVREVDVVFIYCIYSTCIRYMVLELV